jgi:hypothetical protein
VHSQDWRSHQGSRCQALAFPKQKELSLTNKGTQEWRGGGLGATVPLPAVLPNDTQAVMAPSQPPMTGRPVVDCSTAGRENSWADV